MPIRAFFRKNSIIFILFTAILLSLSSFFVYKVYKDCNEIRRQAFSWQKRRVAWLNLNKALGNKVMKFKGTVSIVIRDLNTDWEIAFNKDKPLPSASLVKMPIMLSFFCADQEGRLKLTDTVKCPLSEKMSNRESGDVSGEPIFTIEELFYPMITYSDNSVTNVLIDLLGYDTINSYFKKMGLKNTNLSRKMLDFKERRAGVENYTTAEDMAYLLYRLYYKSFLSQEASQKCLNLLAQQKINDRIPKKLPKGTCVAHKTGLERHICHDVGIVYTDKGNFLICVLVKHPNKLAKPAKEFISEVSLLTYRYYQNLN